MGHTLLFNELSDNIADWLGLPLSLNDKEVVPLDYNAGKTGWIIYGKALNKSLLSKFQRQLAVSIVIVSSWKVSDYQVVRIAGSIPKQARKIAHELKLDVSSIENLPTLDSKGLLIMDMDSTAITIECIDEIAKKIGVGAEVSEITEQAMQGHIDFSTSLRKRVGLLKGTDISVLEEIKANLPIMPGLEYLVNELHKKGWVIAIVSGGFTYFADLLKDKFNLFAVYANELGIDKNQKLTGRLKGAIVDARFKARTLQNLAAHLEIPLEQTVAIGDGANDLMMIRIAGLGVSYHGKEKVIKKARTNINYADLTGLICILSASLDSQE